MSENENVNPGLAALLRLWWPAALAQWIRCCSVDLPAVSVVGMARGPESIAGSSASARSSGTGSIHLFSGQLLGCRCRPLPEGAVQYAGADSLSAINTSISAESSTRILMDRFHHKERYQLSCSRNCSMS
jgi:hypothetical protein